MGRRGESKEEDAPCKPGYQNQFDNEPSSEEEESSDEDDVEAPRESSRQSQSKTAPNSQQQQQMRQSQQCGNPQQQQQQQQQQMRQSQQQKGGPPQQQRQSQQRPGGPQQQQQKRGPPPPGGSRGPPPPRGEKNQKFQDVETTGRWGSISKKEMIIVAAVLLAIIGGVVAAIMLLVVVSPDDTPAAPTPPPTAAPSIRAEVAPELQLPVILNAIKSNNHTNTALSPLLPEDLSFYSPDKVADESQPPSVRAMSWILNVDPRDSAPDDPWLVFRYAVVSIYFSFNGEGWIDQSNWLSDENACTWYGIICDRFNNIVTEVDLTSNNLVGTMPAELGLLTDLRSIVLQRNQVTGTIPSELFGNMPVLSILFLNDNNLQGDLAEIEPLRNNGILCK